MSQNQQTKRIFEQLEDRILFDAVPDGNFIVEAQEPEVLHVHHLGENQQAAEGAKPELIVVDSNVENYSELVMSLINEHDDRTFQVEVLEAHSDGIEQISGLLQTADSRFSAIHIVSHGSDAQLTLGNGMLSESNISAYVSELVSWTDHLTDDADIMIYGCDFASTAAGESLAETIAMLTQADVAVSSDVTGSLSLGGDWDLEHHIGTVETNEIAASSWLGKLGLDIVNAGTAGAAGMANEILGDGITINSATYFGGSNQSGTFSVGDSISFDENILPFETGVIFSTGRASDVGGPNSTDYKSVNANGVDGDADFNAISNGYKTYDASFLDVTFTPDVPEGAFAGDTIRMTLDIIFGSEEYNEYVYGGYNDSLAVIVNGVNQATVPNGLAIGIDTINDAGTYAPRYGSDALDPNQNHDTTDGIIESANSSLYVNNDPGLDWGENSEATYNTNMDGFTKTLPITFDVIAGQANTLKIGVTDTGDHYLDSWMFVRGGSCQSDIVAENDLLNIPADTPTNIDVTANDFDLEGDSLQVIGIADQQVSAGDVITLDSGTVIKLEADGTLTVTGVSGVTETTTYNITDGNGNYATGYLTVDTEVTFVPPPKFGADDNGMWEVYSNLGQLGEIDFANKTILDADNHAAMQLDATGYRITDNYAYGVYNDNGQQLIVRIGSDGSTQTLGQIDGLPNNPGEIDAGDYGPDDLLYVTAESDPDMLFGINVDTLTVENTIQLSQDLDNVFDIAFNIHDNHFYTSQRGEENKLLKISYSDGSVTTVGDNNLQKHTFGAMFSDRTGAIFGASNLTGEVYKFDTVTGNATLAGYTKTVGNNDGFSNTSTSFELPPLAADDTFSTTASAPVSGNLFESNGLAGDFDGNGDQFQLTKVNGSTAKVGTEFTMASGALLTVNADGSFNYDANGAWDDLQLGLTKIESITYTISDGTNESTAEVKIFVGGEFGSERAGVDITPGEVDLVKLKGLNQEHKTLVVSAGDFNGDGYEDVIVGDSSADNSRGQAFVVYGDADGLPEGVDVQTLLAENGGDGSKGMVISGVLEDDRLGAAVAAVGDVNGDGIDDILVGATDRDDNGQNSGSSYLIYGGTNHGAEFQASTLYENRGGDGTTGAVFKGNSANDQSGKVVGGIGDVNNDGLNDFVVVAQDADVDGLINAGESYVVFGNANFGAEVSLDSLDGENGFTIQGKAEYDHLGAQVSGGVDVNADGIDDFVITSRTADTDNLMDAGQSYLFYGKDTGFSATMNVDDLSVESGGTGVDGVVFHGTDTSTGNGSYITVTTDTNGDQIGEIVMGVGAPGNNAAFTILGAADNFDAEFDIISLKQSGVYVDNFDSATDYDERSWDTYTNSVTMHSTEGTRVTIWGDPHVETVVDGEEVLFDIGYGAGSITLSTGTIVRWETYAHDPVDWPLGPPLSDFTVLFAESSDNFSLDTADNVDVVDQLSAMTDSELREFALEIAKYAGSASDPLTYNG